MKSFGIYTLANDAVYDQLVALLNSIEVNISPDIPVCIIPYDEQLEKVKQEVAVRNNVTIYENWHSIQRWEGFARKVWAAHPKAKQSRMHRDWWSNNCYLQRKMCAFDGDFEKFVFIDADSLVMTKPFTGILDKLETYDLVFDDWIHTKPLEKLPLNPFIHEKLLRPRTHSSDFFGGKRSLFQDLECFENQLIEKVEVEWLTKWWNDDQIFNYLSFKSNFPIFNFTLSPDGNDRTGNCAIIDPFREINNIVYNEEGLKHIHRIHYMEYPAILFTRLCLGEDVDIKYRDIFLYYRFLKSPEQRPQKFTRPSFMKRGFRFAQRVYRKLRRSI